MKRKKIILIVFIISTLLIVSGISYNLLIENNNSNIKENDGRRICLLTIWNREMMNRNIIIYIK